MEVNPGLYVAGQTAPGARLFPAFSLVRPTFSVARSWYDSLQASLRMRPAHGMNFLASYTLRARDRSRVGFEHRRRAAAGAAGDDRRSRRRSTRRWRSRRGTRCSTCATASSSASARSCRRRRSMGSIVQHVARRLAGERHRAGADRVPDRRLRSGHGHPLPDQPAGRRRATRTTTRRTPSTSGSIPRASCAARCRTRARDPATPAATRVRGPGLSRTDLSLFKNIDLPANHRIQLRVEAFNLFNQTRFGQPGNQIGTANFGKHHLGRRRADRAARGEVQFLRARLQVPGSGFWALGFEAPGPE